MIETYLRPLYEYFFIEPFAHYLGQRFSQHTITYFACLFGIAVAPALALGLLGLASIFLLISGYLDTMDGTIARLTKTVSEQGAVLDILSDRIVEFAVILGLFFIDPTHRGFLALLMLGSCFICVTSFLVVGIFVKNNSKKGFYYSPGLIERGEAFFCFLMMIWLPSYFLELSLLFTALVFLTAYLRIKQFFISSNLVSITIYSGENKSTLK